MEDDSMELVNLVNERLNKEESDRMFLDSVEKALVRIPEFLDDAQETRDVFSKFFKGTIIVLGRMEYSKRIQKIIFTIDDLVDKYKLEV